MRLVHGLGHIRNKGKKFDVGGVMNFLDFKSNEIFSILSQDKRYEQSSRDL